MYITRSEHVQDVFWTYFVRSIYILCPGRYHSVSSPQQVFVNSVICYISAQKMNFSLKISSVNATKSAGNDGFGHIYWKNP